MAVGAQRNRFQIGNAVAVRALETYVNVRIVVVIFHVVRQDAGLLAANGVGEGVVQVANGRAVVFELFPVYDEAVFGHAFFVGAADVAQAGDVVFHDFFDFMGLGDEFVVVLVAQL